MGAGAAGDIATDTHSAAKEYHPIAWFVGIFFLFPPLCAVVAIKCYDWASQTSRRHPS